MNENLKELAAQGVSTWLDDLSRELLETGELAKLIADRGVVGVTTNPTIFAAALTNGERYAAQIAKLAKRGVDVDEAVFELTTDDVRSACDVFAPIYQSSKGVDGRVSIEVDPRLAHDEAGTVTAAKRLWATVDRPNAMIKIPATMEGLPAITATLAEGISVNVTLIFALERYRAVLNAWLTGLEAAHAAGKDLSTIESVASFFVSRVDTEIDPRLKADGSAAAKELLGKAAIANARLAYQAFEEVMISPRWQVLQAAGARPQRPLWASTGTKDPAYPDTLYVTELVAPNTVNTMPRKTLEAVADHGKITGNTISGNATASAVVLDELDAFGIDYNEVVTKLETEGVSKFEASWVDLLAAITDQLARAASMDQTEAAQ